MQAEARGPIRIEPPTISKQNLADLKGLKVTYGDVPEDFIPKIEIASSNEVIAHIG